MLAIFGSLLWRPVFLNDTVSHPQLNCIQLHSSLQIVFQYSLTRSLFEAKILFNQSSRMHESERETMNNDLQVIEMWFLFRSYFIVVVRLRLLVPEQIKQPYIIGDVYPKSEKFKVLKS